MTLPPDDCLNCFKGIRRAEVLLGEGVDYSVFSDAKPLPELNGWNGSSVNWDLSIGGALQELFDRPLDADGQPHFKFGAISIPRIEVDKIISRYGDNNLAYELREDNGNIFHGHILFSDTLEPRQKTTIYGALVYVSIRHPREYQNN